MRVIKKVGKGFARLPMPAPATVIAMIALLVATGGTAWGVQSATKKAAAPCPTNPKISKSSSKCHFPSWNSLDIINNSLKGIDVKNGSLGASDLSGSARATLKGNRGPTGPAGLAGKNGVNGVNGVNGFGRLDYNANGPWNNSNGAVSFGYALCDSGLRATGGGIVPSEPADQFLVAQQPSDTAGNVSSVGWGVLVGNAGSTAHTFTVYVVCANASQVTKTVFGSPSLLRNATEFKRR